MSPRHPDRSGRGAEKARLKNAGARKVSSQRWLERQLNDPYVAQAKKQGYRSRAAFKLIELDDKFHFLKKGARVLDLGAAPGGWSQVALARIGSGGKLVAADVLEMAPLAGAVVLQCDLGDSDAPAILKEALGGEADVVLTDMAAPTTGHRATDHLRTVALFEAALDAAQAVLKPGGSFVGKVFQGGASGGLLAKLKRAFRDVKHVKPPASRKESVELYLVATGFRGA
ncbi:MAG: RlmE family RNA methyltransferase [Alphaproteobacteria bacterium]|nr:RlmE family RNA methyltransferase [Alphaproteobacteria bacterium]MBV9692717.1 RlmE family RNA methyltransferase [Alphaproteobacteria bacterium]